LPVKIVRPFNTYGPRQSARAVIPTIITQLLVRNDDTIELGDILPTRDMTFVYDTCSAFLEIYHSNSLFGKVINIGMNLEISINDLARLISNLMDKSITIKSSEERLRPEKSEVTRLVCDNSKLLKHTTWKPKYTLEQGITEVITWMKNKNNLSHYKSEIYNV
jgi:dTDP-glucose 4,6-dehydratase